MGIEEFIQNYGLTLGISIWIVIGLARLIKNEIPGLINFWQNRTIDSQEHRQTLEASEQRVKQLEYLSAIGSRTFTEEQLTQMTAETQAQLGESNEFIRREVYARIDLINQQVDALRNSVSSLSEEVYDKVRPDLRQIADNWKATMLEYRHVQTKISIMVTLLEELSRERTNDKDDESV